MFSRLDYIFASDACVQFIENVELLPGFHTDHSTILATLCFNMAKRGPGYWKLNTVLLKDSDCVDKMNSLIDIHLENTKDSSFKDRVELLKLAVRGSTIQYAARKKKAKDNMMKVLE